MNTMCSTTVVERAALCLERKLNSNKLQTFTIASAAEIALAVEIIPFDLKERLISDSPEKASRRPVKAIIEVVILESCKKLLIS